MKTTYDLLKGGSAARMRAMRNYVRQWNENPPHINKLESWKEARSYGVGRINGDAHALGFDAEAGRVAVPASMLSGLRDAGYSDSILPGMRHAGWFADNDCGNSHGTYRGQVWRLPARGRAERFIAGYVEPESGYAVIDCTRGALSLFDSAEDAAHAADELARINAEEERAYDARWNEARELADENEAAKRRMSDIRSQVRSRLKVWRALPADAREERETVCGWITDLREDFHTTLGALIQRKEQIDALGMKGEF